MYRPSSLFSWLVGLVYWLVEALLLLRFIFKLFAANSTAPFTTWLYDTTNVLIHPFRGIFPAPVIDRTFVFDISALIAMVIYALVFEFIIYLFNFLSAPRK